LFAAICRGIELKVFEYKISRIVAGGKPRVLDLFAGCGGISLGFNAAGFDIFGAVELDPVAAKSHALNFHRNTSKEEIDCHAQSRDIVLTEPSLLMKEFGYIGNTDSIIDVIVGGPPCQAFARVGRAKLREIAAHPEAYRQDPRGNLYLRYLHYVKELRPIALLMENVPDVLNYGGHNIAEEVCEVLEELGYEAHYTMLNAVFYGVPEMRERMFLVAFRKEIKAKQWFPFPTHWIALPKGYHGTRQVAMQAVKYDIFEQARYYQDIPAPKPRDAIPAITAEQALSDLPSITCHLEGKLKRGARNFVDKIKYPEVNNLNDYQRIMRGWPNFEASDGIYDHVIRYLPRDYDIFRKMNPGDQYPEAHKHAIELFEERLKSFEKREGYLPKEETREYEEIWKATVPPYDPGKFPNKWRKMEADRPARTLMAHLGKDGYSHIHYDSSQARTISVREAARLQSFPDGFIFVGPMNPAFRQIGNAVPPLMAKALADNMIKQIRGANDKK